MDEKIANRSKNPLLAGLKGLEYRKAWNKINKDSMRKASKAYRASHPDYAKIRHKNYMLANGMTRLTQANRESQKKATMSRERWGPVEESALFSGRTEGELVELLGRSIRAIQHKKRKLRLEEAANKTTT